MPTENQSGCRPTSIPELLDRYTVFLLDAYGVLIDGSGALPDANALLETLADNGKRFFVVSNDASRLPSTASARFREFGLNIPADRIITAGSLLTEYFSLHDLTGSRCRVLGPSDSVGYVTAAGGRVVSGDQDFDILVLADQAGYPFFETVDKTLTALCRQLDRGTAVRLLLPNPDLVYPKSRGQFGFTSGSVALMFEAALALRYPQGPDLRFVRLGKPYGGIFEEAVKRSGTRDLIMIGDQIETDILGASAFGIDSALFVGGLTPAHYAPRSNDVIPTFVLDSLAPTAGPPTRRGI